MKIPIPKDDELFFLPLGGSGEIGMNLNLYGYKGKWLIVDCGVTFGDNTYGSIDIAMPDIVSIEEVKDKFLEVTREVDEGLEIIEVNIPAIVTCDLRLNEPRYASLPNIRKAKKKPLEQINASDLGIDTKPRIELIKVEEPPKRKAGIKVANVAELVQKLKNEAKVI